VASNDCITDTTRYSVRRAGLLFSIGFESNGKRCEELFGHKLASMWKGCGISSTRSRLFCIPG